MATWVGPPKSYTPGRARPIQYVVIHATVGSEGPTSAEDGAAYDKRRTDGTSTHLFVDSNSAVREVVDGDRAHAARFHGNEIGLHVELCGQANQSNAQWHDAASWPELRLAAEEVAVWCHDYGIPARRLSVAEVRAAYYAPAGQRPKGICGHVDVTAGYPEDEGTHADPGPAFPWAEFLGMVAAAAGPTPTLLEDDDMPGLFKTPDDATVWLSDGFRRKALSGTDWANFKATWGDRPIATVANRADLESIAGPVWTPEPPSTGGVDLAAVEAAAEKGAKEGATSAINGATIHTGS